jgi:hypothetical protein
MRAQTVLHHGAAAPVAIFALDASMIASCSTTVRAAAWLESNPCDLVIVCCQRPLR